MNQKAQLMALLRLRGEEGVTPLDALNTIGCFRLAARVWDLRLEGHLIIDEGIKAGGKRYARYVLKAEAHKVGDSVSISAGWPGQEPFVRVDGTVTNVEVDEDGNRTETIEQAEGQIGFEEAIGWQA